MTAVPPPPLRPQLTFVLNVNWCWHIDRLTFHENDPGYESQTGMFDKRRWDHCARSVFFSLTRNTETKEHRRRNVEKTPKIHHWLQKLSVFILLLDEFWYKGTITQSHCYFLMIIFLFNLLNFQFSVESGSPGKCRSSFWTVRPVEWDAFWPTELSSFVLTLEIRSTKGRRRRRRRQRRQSVDRASKDGKRRKNLAPKVGEKRESVWVRPCVGLACVWERERE